MLVILSPSKTQNFSAYSFRGSTNPRFKKQTNEIVAILKNMNKDEIFSFMSISQKLGIETYRNIQKFQNNPSNGITKQAIFAYTGEVFNKINPQSFNGDELNFCQSHFRILSGVYGVLRPLDLIQPYRLEMSSKLKIRNSKSLTKFWEKTITATLNNDEKNIVINLASKEYINSIQFDQLKAKFISIQFKELKNNEYKVVGIYAKKARGKMIHYIVKNFISNPNLLKNYTESGYTFNSSISTENDWVFTRD